MMRVSGKMAWLAAGEPDCFTGAFTLPDSAAASPPKWGEI